MLLASVLALHLLGGGTPDEFSEQLARLGAPRAAERAAAERWLQAHLVSTRYPELAQAALAGDAEVRGRLVRVLGSDARHLPLALALGVEKRAELSALGREAVRVAVSHADPRLAEPAVREGLEVLLRRAASTSPPRDLRLDARLSLAQMVEGLELVGELPLGLTLDPRVTTRSSRREGGLPSAPWNELVLQVARLLGVELEIHGLTRGRESAVGLFLHLTVVGAPARTGIDLVSEWLFVLAQAGDEVARTRAALNLASSGLAPALAWMDELVRTRSDRAAMEGLLLAAARGRVAPALREPAVVEPLLAAAEREGGPASARILGALARAGCLDAEGGALAARFARGFEAASPRARWLRFFLLEQGGCAAPELVPLARAALAEPATAAPLRLEALFFLAGQSVVQPPAPAPLAGSPELFRLDLGADEVERLGRVLRLLGEPPPFADPARIPADWTATERARLLQAWLWRGEPGPLGAHVAAWLQVPPAEARARGELLADELRPWLARGAGALLAGAFQLAQALPAAQVSALERVRLLLGLVPARDVPGVLARGRHEREGERADLALLAGLAAYPAVNTFAGEARIALLEHLYAALGENRSLQENAALARALERAAMDLYSAGLDEEGDAFSKSVQAMCSRSKSELGRWIERRPWPSSPLSETRDVSRALARYEVPASL